MTKYEFLKDAMHKFNLSHERRFKLQDGVLFIGTLDRPFKFTEQSFKEVEKFINKYGMLKEDKDCLADELYYKGFKWDELTDVQRQSVIDSYKYAGSNFITDASRYPALFEDNRCFVEYKF